MYFELEDRTWWQLFLQSPKKKKLYRQEVQEQHSGIQKSSGTSFRRVAAQFKHRVLFTESGREYVSM